MALDKKNIIVSKKDFVNAGYQTGELKPCPFCGGNKILTAGRKNQKTGNIVYHVWCASQMSPFDCNAKMVLCLGKEDTSDECRRQLVEKWNTRAKI